MLESNFLNDLMEFSVYSFEKCLPLRVILYSTVFWYLLKMILKVRSSFRRRSYPKDVVILHQFPRTINLKVPSASPYCLKLETWLRMANINYQNHFTFKMSSKGKIPWITLNGNNVADSQFCIEYLGEKLDKDLNSGIINNLELAAARAFLKLVEGSLSYCITLYRIKIYRKPSENGLPWFLIAFTRTNYLKGLKVQGYGKHTNKEIFSIAKSDLKAINDYIGSRKFLTGNSPCNEDAALFGMLAQVRYQYLGELTDYVLNECPNILRYVDTIKNEFWPDWDANVRNTQTGFIEFLFTWLLSD